MFQNWLDYQSLQVSRSAMQAAWESLAWTRSAAIASWLSILISMITLLLAFYVMNTWKKQEKVNVKRDVKKAAAKLCAELELMPREFSWEKIRKGQATSFSSNYEVLIGYQKEIDEWMKHNKLQDLYFQLKYLGYAVVDDLGSEQLEALKNLDAPFLKYFNCRTEKKHFMTPLKLFLEKLEVYK